MKKLPLSPHLQIYKPQMTSILSISHRISGLIMLVIFPVTLLWIMTLFFGEDSYNFFLKIFNNILVKLVLFLIFSLLTYHSLNGIRHLFWDLGIGVSIKASFFWGKVILFINLLVFLTLFFFFFIK